MSNRPEPESVVVGFAPTYSVELLFEEPPELCATTLLNSIWEHCPDVERPDADEGPLRFFHTGHRVDFPDGAVPVQTFLAPGDGFDPATLAASVKQSWKWRKAKSVAQRCRASVILTDMLASNLDPRLRLGLFQRVLAGVMDTLPCIAMHWIPSQQLVDPAAFQEAMGRGEYSSPLHGALNVRLFQISGYGVAPVPGGTGDSLMDTLGLEAFGIPDLQCHFRGLEHEDVAKVLYGAAYRLFQTGSTLRAGECVLGCPKEAEWLCAFEQALQPPVRAVVDLDPGAPYAAGDR
jgi:hypothetical protein